jgi:hypothetical protein
VLGDPLRASARRWGRRSGAALPATVFHLHARECQFNRSARNIKREGIAPEWLYDLRRVRARYPHVPIFPSEREGSIPQRCGPEGSRKCRLINRKNRMAARKGRFTYWN